MVNKSESIQELVKARIKAGTKVINPKKNAVNPHFKSNYATLDNVIDGYKSAYIEQGLDVSENPVSSDGFVGVQVILAHTSGEYIIYDPYMLPVGKNTAQGHGSSITYARRYALSAVMNIAADDDDDGNVASEQQQPQRRQQNPITQEQVGVIKTKAMTFSGMRDADIGEVYKALKINDLTQLSKQQADKAIQYLDKWIGKANEQGDAS